MSFPQTLFIYIFLITSDLLGISELVVILEIFFDKLCYKANFCITRETTKWYFEKVKHRLRNVSKFSKKNYSIHFLVFYLQHVAERKIVCKSKI